MCYQSRAHCGDRDRALQLHVTAELPELQVCEGVKPLPLSFCWDLNSQGDTSSAWQDVPELRSLQCTLGWFGALALTLKN